jgi:hypothetical protein
MGQTENTGRCEGLMHKNGTCSFILLVSRVAVMINRDSWGHEHNVVDFVCMCEGLSS